MSDSLSSLAATPPIIKRPSRAPYILLSAVAVFVLLFAATTWQSWFPAPSVDVVRVISIKHVATTTASQHAQEQVAASGPQETAFQAAGWVEADPQVTAITAQVSGIVQSVSVLDGESVKAGQEIARLIDDDFKIALMSAQASVTEAQARLEESKRQLQIGETHVKAHDTHHQLALAKVAERQDIVDRYQKAGDAVSTQDRQQAALALKTAQAQFEAVHSDLSIREATVKKYQAQVRVDEAKVAVAQARLAQAQLNLERCIIRAANNGTIQELFAYPGRKQMLGSDNPTSTSVATIFDPKKLQARVDIALEDSAGLFIGQDARITCNALPQQQFKGVVTRILGVADIARNTLQAKVKIIDPIPLLRPDMLVKVQFLGKAPQAQRSNTSKATHLAHYVPETYFSDRATALWSVDEHMRLQSIQVQYGQTQDGMIEITSGVRAGMYLLTHPPAQAKTGMQVSIKEIIHD